MKLIIGGYNNIAIVIGAECIDYIDYLRMATVAVVRKPFDYFFGSTVICHKVKI